ncbi:MAG: hypothetical protein ABL949_12390 [Fimbriimonadaceae bacterium]
MRTLNFVAWSLVVVGFVGWLAFQSSPNWFAGPAVAAIFCEVADWVKHSQKTRNGKENTKNEL